MSETEEEDLDLLDILSEDITNHKWCFDSLRYGDWEREIATPALEAKGYKVGRWWSTDHDSFGPLVRAVELAKDGVTRTYTYG